MPEQGYYLSETDRNMLQGMLRDWLGDRVNTQNRTRDDSTWSADLPATQAIIAKVPAGGIPIMSGVTPGSKLCKAYRWNQSTGLLNPVGSALDTEYLLVNVLNLTSTIIPAGSYLPVVKERFSNDWLPAASGGSPSPPGSFDGARVPFGTQSIPTGTNTLITAYAAFTYDTSSYWDAINHGFNLLANATYDIGFNVYWENQSANNHRRILVIDTGGLTYVADSKLAVDTSDYTYQSASMQLKTPAGSSRFVQVYAFQNSGLSVTLGPESTSFPSAFWVERLA